MLFTLAIFPSIALLIYVYKKDKKEKEPIKFLLRLFFWGVVLAIPASFIEEILDSGIAEVTTAGSFANAILEGFLVAACVEELGKYFILKKITWKSKYFDCMFDGIVYAVFVSLGFASIENILYVFEDGIGVAILRMFSSIPGHTCFAIYMGYFYSKARLYINKGDVKTAKKYKRQAMYVPIVLHGIYDSLIMLSDDAVGEVVTSIAFLIWMVFIVIFFIRAFKLVSVASKNDEYIARLENGWKCRCGRMCFNNFCADCGRPRMMEIE